MELDEIDDSGSGTSTTHDMTGEDAAVRVLSAPVCPSFSHLLPVWPAGDLKDSGETAALRK